VPINVFLSVGRPCTAAQDAFVAAAELHLARHGLHARTVGRNATAGDLPIAAIGRLMDRSAGVLVIALERLAIERAAERRGASDEAALADIALATPWIHVEAALAYAKRLPLFVVREHTVRADGLLEDGHGWPVHVTRLTPDFVHDPAFAEAFARWKRAVTHRARWFRYRSRGPGEAVS